MLRIAGLASRVSVVPRRGHSAEDVKRALMRLPAVAAVQSAAATTDAVDQRMAQFTDVLLVTVAVAVLMALLVAYNSTVINADEHSRENATIFAYGVSTARVTRDMMIEALLTGVLAGLTGTIIVSLLTLKRLKTTDIPSKLRVVD